MHYFLPSSPYTQFPQVKQEESGWPLDATPQLQFEGVAPARNSWFIENGAGFEQPPAGFFNTYTASSGASTMSQKRPPPSDLYFNTSPPKHIKAEHPEEFSNAVKKRLQSSTRTGQACDRCKIRKIRCDDKPGGCTHCAENNGECWTTDRITGRATCRGYVEGLEKENQKLKDRLHEMEHKLVQHGVDIRPSHGLTTLSTSEYGYNTSSAVAPWSSPNPYTPHSSSPVAAESQEETNAFKNVLGLPTFRPDCPGDNYLGVSPGNSNISSIKGTALSILGVEIDIADFDSPDMDEPDPLKAKKNLYNKSYQAFLQSALNVNQPLEVALPSREEGLSFTAWYFRVLNPYMPLLHRPTFMTLLTRMYDDPTFKPSVAEEVMVHMVFAIMFFQYAARNWGSEDQSKFNDRSNNHYHFSMSKFYQLSCSHTVQDVQALTLICMHLRNFPKPGASWILSQTTMSLAIELGLHRSAKGWTPEITPNILDVEMRKRTFWAILTIHVTLSGKLGRPMPFRIDDFDVEMPESMDDELMSEEGFDTSRPGRCAHEVGLQGIRLIPLYMELYSTIYAVRRHPETYVSTIRRLEAKISAWKEGLPPQLVNGEAGSTPEEGRVFALYAEIWALEFRMLLRHPAVSLTLDSAFNAENMRICLEASQQMLQVVRQLQQDKSLDTTWYNTAVYAMAITIRLFVQWDKRGSTSAADLAALRGDIDMWLDVMGEVGALLGSGTRLRESISNVADNSFRLLGHHLPMRNNNYTQNDQMMDSTTTSLPRRTISSGAHTETTPTFYNNPQNPVSASVYASADTRQIHTQTPYPTATQYSSYSEPDSSTIAYAPQGSSGGPYAATYPTSSHDVHVPILDPFAQAIQAQQQGAVWPQGSPHVENSGSYAWQQWVMVTGNPPPQVYDATAALMQLGNHNDGLPGPGTEANTALNTMAASAQDGSIGMMQTGNGNVGGHVNGSVLWPHNFDPGH